MPRRMNGGAFGFISNDRSHRDSFLLCFFACWFFFAVFNDAINILFDSMRLSSISVS